MWILESSSELFQGRRMWLKPGKSYLFGRVKKDGVRFAIDNKTISRKHFIIKVEDALIEDVGNIHARTKIVIEDQNSKAGTYVNGEHLKGSTKELSNAENIIKPGTLPEDLHIKWFPCVLTFNLLRKELKSGVLKAKQERVRELDIKAISEYIVGQTTHVVVNKRNTPRSLQALIDGKPLVAESYIDSLEYAATPSDLNEEENLSPLEQDFDSAWPAAFEHLPPPGREPTSRPAESYRPESKRKNVFENFTFVFLDQGQLDNLLPPITTGHGKALLFNTVVGETNVDDLVTFLKNSAGRKGFGNVQKDVDKGAVILVRYKGDAGAEEWTNSLINEASLRLDQRAVDQGEFLDAILANNGMLLRQSVPFESSRQDPIALSATEASSATGARSTPAQSKSVEPQNMRQTQQPQVSASQPTLHSQTSNGQHQTTSNGAPEEHQSLDEDDPAPPVKKARFIVPSKSKGFDFDDEFDPNLIQPYQDEDDDQMSGLQTSQTPRQSTPSQIDAFAADSTPSRKRLREASRQESTAFEDDMDELLPAAAAMKRRKLVLEAKNVVLAEPTKNKPIPALLKKPKPEKEINVREMARAQRRAEEEKAAKEQDDLDDEFRPEPGQPLPVYEVETVFFDPPAGKARGSEVITSASAHWNADWNGRKNFKGFRRARGKVDSEVDGASERRNHAKVIVPLIDAKASTYGMGDQYWEKTQEEKEREREKKRKASQKATQSQSDQSRASYPFRSSQTAVESDSEDDDNDTANEDTPRTRPEIAKLQSEAAEVLDHLVDIEEPRRTRASGTQDHTQTTTQSTRGGKRTANGPGRPEAAKRQKTLPVNTVRDGSDSDDSDDLKFKFGSRRGGRGKV